MDAAWLGGLVVFAFAMAGTPGPNNTMSTAQGVAYGMGRTMPFLSGVAVGVAAITSVTAAFGATLVSNPTVAAVLKWAGLAYLLWLAWKIGSAELRPLKVSGGQAPKDRPLGFIQGALVQFVNPKLWIMVSGAVVSYGHSGAPEGALTLALVFALVLGGATYISAIVWASLGAAIGRKLKTPRAVRSFNVTMALLLVLSLLPIIFQQ